MRSVSLACGDCSSGWARARAPTTPLATTTGPAPRHTRSSRTCSPASTSRRTCSAGGSARPSLPRSAGGCSADRSAPVAPARSVLLVAGGGGGAGLLGQRGDRELAAGGLLEHAGGLLGGAGVELDEQVDDDLVVVVLVEADVGEELARAVVAEGREGQGVRRLGAGAGLDGVGVDRHRARGHPWRPGDHPLPAVLDRLDAAVVEREVRLVVHAVEALDDGLLQLVDDLGALAGHGIDA